MPGTVLDFQYAAKEKSIKIPTLVELGFKQRGDRY